MNDPYKEVFEEIGNAFSKHTKMMVFIAERTMTVKDFKEFMNEFVKGTDSETEKDGGTE